MPTSEEYKSEGNKNFQAGRLNEAITSYLQAIGLKSDFKEAWSNLGQCYFRKCDFNRALDAFEKAIAIDSGYKKALYRRAETLMKLENYREAATAIDHIEPLFTSDKEKVQLRKHLQICQARIGAQVHFGVIDLKLTASGKVRILEFGPGLVSGFGGFDTVTTGPKTQELLCHELRTLGIPFFLGHFPGIPIPHTGYFQATGGIDMWPERETWDIADASTYRGLYGSFLAPTLPNNVLQLNGRTVSDLLMDDKVLAASAMKAVAPDVRPMTFITTNEAKDRDLTIIQQALQKAGYEYCVMKTPNGNGAEGVKIIKVSNFIREYKNVFDQLPSMREKIRSLLSTSIGKNAFMSSVSKHIVVESFEPSRLIEKEGKDYDATMRVGFLIVRNKGVTRVKYLNAFWKLPAKAQGHGGFHQQTISVSQQEIAKDPLACTKLVASEDKALVFSQLDTALPKIFNHVWQEHAEEVLKRTTSVSEKNYILTRLACNFAHSGEFVLAHHYADLALVEDDRNGTALLNKGRVYSMQENYAQAILVLQKSLAAGELSAHFRLGEAYYLDGNQRQANTHFQAACRFGGKRKVDVFFYFAPLDKATELKPIIWSPLAEKIETGSETGAGAGAGEAEHRYPKSPANIPGIYASPLYHHLIAHGSSRTEADWLENTTNIV